MCLRVKERFTFLRVVVLFVILFTNCSLIWSKNTLADEEKKVDGISIYEGVYKQHGSLYNWMWGKHYRSLYYVPIKVNEIDFSTWSGGLSLVEHMPNLYGLLLKNRDRQYYLLKELGLPTSFVESSFFRKVYNKDLYRNTYLGDFIKEATTIENPFGFIISENLAKKLELNTSKINLLEVTADSPNFFLDSTSINDKLVSIYHFPNLDSLNIMTQIDNLLTNIHDDKGKLDKQIYLRSRLFDMLIGDWNKIPENWGWLSAKDSIYSNYRPIVLDRSHAFTKVDGVFFKRLLGMLGLGFITNYDAKMPDIMKVNKLGYPLDLALTANYTEEDWLEQAQYIQATLTDSILKETYNLLPEELQIADFEIIMNDIKSRRSLLDQMATKYYAQLQKTPILVAKNVGVLVETKDDKKLHVCFLNKETDNIVFDKIYDPKNTKEIWLYILGTENDIVLDKQSKPISLLLINQEGSNNYNIKAAQKTKIYTSQLSKDKLDSLSHVKTITTKEPESLAYDYQKFKYAKFAITPIGVYDSDLGLNIGTSISYTKYGFRRRPFTSQHQLSYNYSKGLTYQGIYPIFDSNSSLHILAFASNTKSFYNFFGIGNETDRFSGKNKKYNRVHFDKYLLKPSFNHDIDPYQEVSLAASFEIYKLKNPQNRNRYINTVYEDDNDIFRTKNYIELELTYSFQKKMSDRLQNLSITFNPGWIINVKRPSYNVPYAALNVGLNLKLTNRLVLATLLKGKALFSNRYEFYQAATTDLRGFRDNQFIGKQSFYEYTDLRLDMGQLENPLTPVSYGLFVGADHGRVWYPDEYSRKWYASFGGGFWLTLFKQVTTKFSYFASNEHEKRFMFELGLSF